jgi:pimeloyl-ACP methyl ester carboxylesterase
METTQQITVSGRTVELHASGSLDADDCVVLLHAAPGGGSFDPDPAATADAGVLLVGIDRPGYGGSTPFAAGTWPTVGEAADDVAAVLDHLGRTRAALAGWSAGGRVALACAARHPDRVSRVAVIGTPAPQEEVPWVPAEQQQMVDELATLPADQARTGLLEVLGEVFGGEHPPEWWLSSVGSHADASVLDDPAHRARLAASLGHGMGPGISGMTDDILAYCSQPWGFDADQVGAPTILLYGEDDETVPEAHGRWWERQLPDAELSMVPDIGHVVVVPAWGRALEHLVGGRPRARAGR